MWSASLALLVLAAPQVQTHGGPVRPFGERVRTNVLVVVADDLGWSERDRLPSLDALAAAGVTFERFYAYPLCSPTRYALLHGMLPRRAGIGHLVNAFDSAANSPQPDRRALTLFEALKPTHATCLVGKWHLGRASEGGRVDLLDSSESGPFVAGADDWLAGSQNSINPGGYYAWSRVDNGRLEPAEAVYATDAQRDAFIGWWLDPDGDQDPGNDPPKFALLSWSAPHFPYDAPPGRTPTGSLRGDYEQVIDYLDGALAAALAVVDLRDTLVVFLGDNGTPNEVRLPGTPAGQWKATTFEGGVRVPMIVAGAGLLQPGRRSTRLVSCTDIAATLLEVLGVESRGFRDSRSFADELGLFPGAPARDWIFVERYGFPADDQAVIEARWKLRVWDADGPGFSQPVTRLFDLQNDPGEVNPLLPSAQPAHYSRLSSRLASLPPRL